ncbi:MAG: dethiobiotin synthase [Prochlorococcus sp.]|nr:dethiobiotin synthase [Prochlorococcaceae cyanobacterium ETNP18_MAG_14]
MTPAIPRLIVCGTDTNVGKTVVSALLVQGLGATYWKPVQSGLEGGGDRERLCRLLNLPDERWLPEAYRFQAPVSPHWAAEQENCCIHPNQLVLPAIPGPLVVEAAGGLMVPLNRQWLQIDQLQHWRLPLILVARSGLGTINHTLLSLEALRLRKLPILGLVLNGPSHPDNPKTLEQFGGVPVIAELPPMPNLTAAALAEQWHLQDLSITFKRLLKPWSEPQ